MGTLRPDGLIPLAGHVRAPTISPPPKEHGMQYDEFITRVQDAAAVESRNHAELATTATLETLGQRLSAGEADNLAAQLPAELKAPLDQTVGDAESFDVDEFLRRVADREGLGCSTEQARDHARAVMSTVAGSVSAGEIDDVRSQLPPGYEFLMQQ